MTLEQEELITQNYEAARLYGRAVAARMTNNNRSSLDEGESIADEALCLAAQRFDPSRNVPFSIYMMMVIRSQVIKFFIRDFSKHMSGVSKLSIQTLTSFTFDDICGKYSEVSVPDETQEEMLKGNCLFSDIDELCSAKEQKIIALRMCGLAYTEIADTLGIPLQQVRNAQNRIKRKIRQYFEEEANEA